MGHGIGEEAFVEAVPDAIYLLFAILTQLGDVWFYVLALTLAYALGETIDEDALSRERVAVVMAVALGAIAVSALLKETFAHPRPPGAGSLREIAWLPSILVPLFADFATADGFSLPSGHATGSAATYGAAALLLRYGRDRIRYLLAGLAVLVIAASRVVIGVHYLGDVLLGVLAGSAYLTIVYWATDRGARVKRAFSLAVLVAAVGAAAHFSFETIAALGGALGGRVGWTLFGPRATEGTVTRREGTLAAAIAIPVGGGLVGAAYALDAPVSGFLGSALGIAVILSAPLVARRR
ncbi:phosphatase PAP2 family protein [Natronomonas sp. EA1]|uniref:phosphatase PAP2 family protein n=1 Tax=Natronomonas sp. EA1 TaxID=3421655 RepID=UPI003EBBDD20